MVKRRMGGIKMVRIEALRKELYEICDKTNTSRTGIEHLIKYYIESLGWTEDKAIEYAIGLFHNGTIEQIKFIGEGGEEL